MRNFNFQQQCFFFHVEPTLFRVIFVIRVLTFVLWVLFELGSLVLYFECFSNQGPQFCTLSAFLIRVPSFALRVVSQLGCSVVNFVLNFNLGAHLFPTCLHLESSNDFQNNTVTVALQNGFVVWKRTPDFTLYRKNPPMKFYFCCPRKLLFYVLLFYIF